MDKSDRTKVAIRKCCGGYVGSVDIPLVGEDDDTDSRLHVQAEATSKREALARAAGIAAHIMDDPIVQSVLPPNAKYAITAAKLLAAHSGDLKKLGKLWGSLRGSNKRKLAIALAKETVREEHGEEAVGYVEGWFRKLDKKRRRRGPARGRRTERELDEPEDQDDDVVEPSVEAPVTDFPDAGGEAEDGQ